MHAHTHLLVHRDIKPANVMVDEQGRLRLLDFGIAVPAQEKQDAADRYMTPGFAAPEQLAGGDITTATDIYQLGETLRRITLASADGAAPSWPGPVRAGLQAIIARATAPAPSQRYDSVARLHEDLSALRQFLPVRALGGGLGYRIGLMVRRHPRSAALVALLFLLAATSAVSLLRSLAREAQERHAALREEHTAGAIGNFFVELFQDPVGDGGVAGLLDRGQQRLLANRHEAPETRAALLHALAMANLRMERPETARTLLSEAISTQNKLGPMAHSDLALSMASLARIKFLGGASEQAFEQAAQAQALLDGATASPSHSYFLALAQLGELRIHALHFAEADALLERAVDLGIRRYGKDSAQLFDVRRLQLESLRNQWQVTRALPISEALGLECERRFGADDPICIVEATHQARVFAYAGKLAAAEQRLRQLLAKSPTWTGKHRLYRIHAVLFNLAETLWLKGDYPQARQTLEESLEKLALAQGGSSGPHWDSDRGALALLLMDMGQPEQAYTINSARVRRTSDKPAVMEDHFWIVRHAPLELAIGRVEQQTDAALAQAVQALSKTYGERSYFASRARLVHAQLMHSAGQVATAQQQLELAARADHQGLRMHHAQLLAEVDLLRAKLAAQRGDQAQVALLHAAALAHLPIDLYAADHPFRAAMQTQILLSRNEPLSSADQTRLQQAVAALRNNHHPASALVLAAQRRLQTSAAP